jgi:hypothetical protein
MIISDKTYIDPEKNCGVLWVSETAAAHGSIYSAHMQCFSSGAEPKKYFDNLLILANWRRTQTTSRWDLNSAS